MNRIPPLRVFFRPGIGGIVPDAWILEPGTPSDARPVVLVHGLYRNVEEMVGLLQGRAEDTRRTLILPHFDKAHWPRYQRAACDQRADWAMLTLLRALRSEGRIGQGPVDLSGFSGGAQFAHRFAWLYPDAVGRLCLAAPGWWTFPDAELPWPYGMGDRAGDGAGDAAGKGAVEGFWLRANLPRFFDREIVVRVGTDDTQRDENLRKGNAIDAQQGGNRALRAQRWVAHAAQAARAAGVTPDISFGVLQGCGHNLADCVRRGRLDRDLVAAPACAGDCAQCAIHDRAITFTPAEGLCA